MLVLKETVFDLRMANLLPCKVPAAAHIFLTLEIPSAQVECCPLCLIKDLDGHSGGLAR